MVKQEVVEAVQEEKASHAKARGDLQQALAVAKKAKESNESCVVASQARFDMLGTQLEEAVCERDRTAKELEVQAVPRGSAGRIVRVDVICIVAM